MSTQSPTLHIRLTNEQYALLKERAEFGRRTIAEQARMELESFSVVTEVPDELPADSVKSAKSRSNPKANRLVDDLKLLEAQGAVVNGSGKLKKATRIQDLGAPIDPSLPRSEQLRLLREREAQMREHL